MKLTLQVLEQVTTASRVFSAVKCHCASSYMLTEVDLHDRLPGIDCGAYLDAVIHSVQKTLNHNIRPAHLIESSFQCLAVRTQSLRRKACSSTKNLSILVDSLRSRQLC